MKNQIMKIVIVLTCCVSFASVANATFIVDTDPGGEKFYINKDFEKKEGISAFTGEVGSNGDVAMVNVTTIGAVDTGNGYANVKPAKHAILTSLSFFASIHPPGFQTHSPRHGVLNWFVNVS